MKHPWRVLVVFLIFSWVIGNIPAWTLWHDPNHHQAWAVLYSATPLFALAGAFVIGILAAPVICLLEWAFPPDPQEEEKNEPQELYIRGDIDIDELEKQLTRIQQRRI